MHIGLSEVGSEPEASLNICIAIRSSFAAIDLLVVSFCRQSNLDTSRRRLFKKTMSTCRAFTRGTNIMRAVISNGKGGVSVTDRSIPVPNSDEHLIKVAAVGVNRADVLQAHGKYPPPTGTTDVLGLEAAGYLENGQLVTALLKGGGFAEYVVAPKSAVLSFPKRVQGTLSPVQLAALPEAFLAAFHVLFQKGKLSENETVLINAAASGVGTSAIQLAKTVPNVAVIASASTQEKLDFCRTLGATHVINYKQESISASVKKVTNGSGVDLLLDCVGAEQFKENETSLKTDGRWVMYGLLSGAKSTQLGLAGIVSKRITISGTTLRSRSEEYRGNLVQEFSSRFGDSFTPSGRLRPIIDKVFSGLESVSEAFQYLEDNKTIGKLVVEL